MSGPTEHFPYTDAQRGQAAEWFITIRAENDPKAESIQAWLRWMDQHEGNRSAFDAVVRAWNVTPAWSASTMPSPEELSADDYDGAEPIETWLAKQAPTAASSAAASLERSRRFTKRAWLAVAATVLIAISSAFAVFHYWDGARTRNEFATQSGEQIEITLSDGSHVWLGPRSKLRLNFDETRRGIQLATGEAFFAVKKDPKRPFTVRSAGGDIVAVGTAFNVRAVDEHVIVSVSEGMVAVTPKTQLAARTPTSVRVASGQELAFSAEQSVKALAIVQSPSSVDRGRWREGVLVYRDEPLHYVVNDVARYSNVDIEVADAAIGNLHYSGVIYHDAVQEWLLALPESFPVTIVSDGSREIIKAR